MFVSGILGLLFIGPFCNISIVGCEGLQHLAMTVVLQQTAKYSVAMAAALNRGDTSNTNNYKGRPNVELTCDRSNTALPVRPSVCLSVCPKTKKAGFVPVLFAFFKAEKTAFKCFIHVVAVWKHIQHCHSLSVSVQILTQPLQLNTVEGCGLETTVLVLVSVSASV